MDLQTWLPSFTLSALFILGVSIIFLWKTTTARRRNKLPYPPGPPGLPLIGNMLMMDQLTHRGLAQLNKQYGEIVHLRLGFLHMVSVSSPKLAQEILQTQDITFSNKPATAAITYLTYNRSDMAFANYGPFWRQMRKLCVMKLFSKKRAQTWACVHDEIESTVGIVASKCGSTVEIGELVFELTNNITFRAAFASSLKEHQSEFVSIIQEFSLLFSAFNLADFFPGLSWIDPQGLNKRLYKARKSLDGFIDKIIDDHLEKKTKIQGETDMVDELLDFYYQEANQNKSDGLQLSISLTKENIKAMIMDIMFGGTETVASGIEWAMAELLKSPEDLKLVQQELDEVVGVERRVDESDLDKLTYFKCVIKEVLRLHPPIPLLLHESSADAELDGYYIPARSHVVVNAWAIGRDETLWEEASVFKPARFLEKDAPDFKGNTFEYLPFGSGRRSCPGMQLGLFALEMAVAHLVHCFSWELPEGMDSKKLNMEDVCGLTVPRAIQLIAVPTFRLKCDLL